MTMLNTSLEHFAADLASSSPTPGGGGAAALAGALAAALGNMVGNLTIGKKKYAQNEPRLKQLDAMAERLRGQLLQQIDADAEAFEPLSKAYSIPKDQEGRDETLEQCLHQAAEPPMQILRLSCNVIQLVQEYAELGSKLMISDAGCAASLAKSAVQCAALNVYVNTRLMKDKKYADSLMEEVKVRMDRYLPAADDVYQTILEALQ